jgi:hypothetical protein
MVYPNKCQAVGAADAAAPRWVVGWCRTILGIGGPAVIHRGLGGGRRDFSRLGAVLRNFALSKFRA